MDCKSITPSSNLGGISKEKAMEITAEQKEAIRKLLIGMEHIKTISDNYECEYGTKILGNFARSLFLDKEMEEAINIVNELF